MPTAAWRAMAVPSRSSRIPIPISMATIIATLVQIAMFTAVESAADEERDQGRDGAVETGQLSAGLPGEVGVVQALVVLHTLAGEVRVGERDPVDDEHDHRPAHRFDIGLGLRALRRQQRGDEDRAVDQASGIGGHRWIFSAWPDAVATGPRGPLAAQSA